MKKIGKPLIFIFSLLLLACFRGPLFEKKIVFEDLIWNRFNIIELEVPFDKADINYDVKVSFVHTDVYPTDHIAMNITFYFPNGAMRSRDYEFKLQDANLQWTGKKEGEYYEHLFPVNLGMRIPETGVTKVRIENKMTKFNMAGIYAVGLLVEKSKK